MKFSTILNNKRSHWGKFKRILSKLSAKPFGSVKHTVEYPVISII
jgi:hypothetical protein